jgi:UDP-GlcNAc:undecaprenyl-phosphate GlcNAc-1-phosphate transferase
MTDGNILLFLIAFFLALLFTPAAMRVALRVGAMDQPNKRKVHASPIPRLGGVAIAASCGITIAVAGFLYPELLQPQSVSLQDILLFTGAFAVVVAVGIIDDITPMKAGTKFLGQLLAASVAYLAGFQITSLDVPLMDGPILLGPLSFPVTVIWITGITNALNLVDGLDGLASGISVISSLTVFAIAATLGQPALAMVALVLAGSIVGFLRYNFYPARIFLGDSGSLFLGFALSMLTMAATSERTKTLTLVVPLLALGLPVADMSLALLRRFLRTLLPHSRKQSARETVKMLFTPDRNHIHHQLMARGLSHRSVVIVLYGISLALGSAAYIIALADSSLSLLLLALVVGAGLWSIRHLQYRELPVHRNGILLRFYNRFYEWPLLQQRVFQGVVDVLIVCCAYGLSHWLAGSLSKSAAPDFARGLGVAVIAQVGAFWGSGLYRETTRHMGIGDALRIFRSVALAAIALVFGEILTSQRFPGPTFIALDFFFLGSLVGGSRFSYSLLSYLLHRDFAGRKRTAIVGANPSGLLVLQMLLEKDGSAYAPIGFIDEDPLLEGKSLNGFPIFGGHLRLGRLIELEQIEALIMPDDRIPEEVRARIHRMAGEHRLEILRASIGIEELADVTPTGVPSPLTSISGSR